MHKSITMQRIVEIVKQELGISVEDLISKSRMQHLVKARSLFTFLARKAGFSFSAIGRFLDRDHSTAMHLLKISSRYPEIEEIYKKNSGVKGIIKLKVDNRYKKYAHVYERFGGKCIVCGFSETVEIHHIIPKYMGGTDEPNNLLVLCPNHHALVHSGQLKIEDINIEF